MNRKQFILLLVLVVVVGGIGLALYNKSSKSYQGSTRAGQKLLCDFNVNDVAHIRIKDTKGEVNIVKTGDAWTVKERGNHPANFEQMSDLVRKANDLKVVQTLKVGPSQRPRLELVEPGKGDKAGTLVEFKGAGNKEIKTFLLGAKHMRKQQGGGESPFGDEPGGYPDGRYIMTSLNSDSVAVVSDPISNADPKPEFWLNKDFFKVEKLKSVSIQSPEATNSWSAARESENGSWTIADAKPEEKFDTNKLSSLSYAMNNPSFTDVVVDKKPEEIGLDKPTVVKLTTFDGFEYTLNVGKTTADDNYYAKLAVNADLPKARTPGKDEKPEDKEKLDKEFKESTDKLQAKLNEEKAFEKWIYTLPKWSVEQVLKKRSELYADKEEPKTAEHSEGDGHDHGNEAGVRVEAGEPPASDLP
jgi:hypothetical protein